MGVSTKLEGVWFLTLAHLAWNDPTGNNDLHVWQVR